MRLTRQRGNVADMMSTCICILAISTLLVFFLQVVGMLQQKQEVGQLARKYILRMETVGYLTPADEITLDRELSDMGLEELCLDGTTRNRVGYGETISLSIRGRLKGGFAFEEKRVSTAKN